MMIIITKSTGTFSSRLATIVKRHTKYTTTSTQNLPMISMKSFALPYFT